MISVDYNFINFVGGVYCNCSSAFNRGSLPDVARCLKANVHDSGVLIEYY